MNTNILPRWAYLALALACVCMGLWASYITLEYFEHGAKALESDSALQALAVSAAVMFVASEMAAFSLAALLTERQLKARRWSLTGFAGAVMAMEVFTIVAVQLALTSGANLAQNTVQTQEKDLRARIALIEADAAAKRATAEQQRATAKTAYELHLAGKSSDKAAAEQAKTAALYDELTKVQAQKRPTLVGLLGEKPALAYAIARGVLVSLGGLVFFGVAGALLRASRGGAQSVDAQLLALLHELRGTPGAMPIRMAMQDTPAPAPAPALAAPVAPAQTVAPAAPAPAPASFRPAGTVAPKDASTGLPYSSKTALAGAGALAAMAAPMAHAAPAVPAVPAAAGASASEAKQPHLTAAKQSHPAEAQQAHTGAAEPAELAGMGEAKQSHLSAAKPPHPAEAQQGHAGAADAAELAGMGEAKQPHLAEAQQAHTGTADAAEPAGLSEAEQSHLSEAKQSHLDSASDSETGASKRAWSATVVPDGTKLDTGTSGKAATRYNRIKAAVKAGKLKPSMRAIQAAEGGGGVVVRAYLQQLETEGVTVRAGRGWVLAQKGGAA